MTFDESLAVAKLIVSIATPALVLYFGLQINRGLHRTKAALDNQREWENKWANAFYDAATSLNEHASSCVCNLSSAVNYMAAGDNDLAERLTKEARDANVGLAYGQWDIQKYIQFAPTTGPALKRETDRLIEMIFGLQQSGGGDLEPIRKQQFAFSKAAKATHAELLALDTDS